MIGLDYSALLTLSDSKSRLPLASYFSVFNSIPGFLDILRIHNMQQSTRLVLPFMSSLHQFLLDVPLAPFRSSGGSVSHLDHLTETYMFSLITKVKCLPNVCPTQKKEGPWKGSSLASIALNRVIITRQGVSCTASEYELSKDSIRAILWLSE